MSNVRTEQRFARGRRCPICGGAEGDPRGKERRCTGYLSADGKYAHCSREEHAGGIERTENSETFAHRLEGSCKCGVTHREAERAPSRPEIYDYQDERKKLLFQVVRFPGKGFRQRRPNVEGDRGEKPWIWSTDGVRLVPYRLPELLAADPAAPVYLVEGEKDVETLRRHRLIATTNPRGAKKWNSVNEAARPALTGRHVVILPDADAAGRAHAEQVKRAVAPFVASLRVIELYPSGQDGEDVSDWFGAGGTAARLEEMRATTPEADLEAARAGAGKDERTDATDPPPPYDPDVDPIADRERASEQEAGAGQPEPPADPFEQAIQQALAEIRTALDRKAKRKRRPLFGTDAALLLGRDFPGPQWKVTGLLTDRGTGVVGGTPKESKKTWIATEIAVAIATGTKAFGEFFAVEGTVAYFYAEDTDRQVRNRVRALLAGAGRTLPIAKLHLEPRGEFLDVMVNEDLAWLVASARQLGKLDLIVLDPLRDLHSGEEDKSDSMRDVMRRIRLLGELVGCGVLVVHHAGKPSENNGKRGGGQRLRGSGAIHGSIDSGLYVLETTGDGVCTFEGTIESEIKGAQSAGVFKLALTVEDDERREAVRAAWRFERIEKPTEPKKTSDEVKQETKRQAEEVAERIAFEFVRALAMRGEVLTRNALRYHDENPIAELPLYHALNRLIGAGRLQLGPRGVVVLPPPPPEARC